MDAVLRERDRGPDARLDDQAAHLLAFAGQVPGVLQDPRIGVIRMGFNPIQPGKIKRADLLMFVFGLVMIAAALVWVLR